MRDEGVELKKIAVLFRAAFHSQALEMELARRDIPYDYRGGIRFFERAHIKDVLAYLKIINNIEDTIAWSRILNMQIGIGPATAQKIIREVSRGSFESVGSSLPARAKIGWNDFLSIWNELQKQTEKDPTSLIKAILKTKYTEYLESEHPDYRERIQDIEQLALFAERAVDLNRFLAEASLQESYASSQVSDADDFDEEKIVLSTIHQAKGLEWEAVFVINLSAGQFPNERSRVDGSLEEERRLFYVAVTRAKKFLYLTYPIVGGFTSYLQGPSLFLEELSRDLISQSGFSGESTAFLDPSDDVDDIVYEPVDNGGPTTSFLRGIDEL